ncbi:unnamed protein product [Protopolystoma xenopodis]|uniref:Uncharacterized protein n=1 Tax=Protopolystoma xenopodis TaxID=117903 RepID=A0A3S5AAJ1_9PLAT|nr:unnamed protein product [Protopolystoma xenopodis]
MAAVIDLNSLDGRLVVTPSDQLSLVDKFPASVNIFNSANKTLLDKQPVSNSSHIASWLYSEIISQCCASVVQSRLRLTICLLVLLRWQARHCFNQFVASPENRFSRVIQTNVADFEVLSSLGLPDFQERHLRLQSTLIQTIQRLVVTSWLVSSRPVPQMSSSIESEL